MFGGSKNKEQRVYFLVMGIFLFSFFIFSHFSYPKVEAAIAPTLVTYQGKLLTSGNPVTTTVTMQFKLYNVLTGGSSLFSTSTNVTPSSGLFSVDLNISDPTLFRDNQDIYLEVTVGSETLSPRKQITASPYAYNAKYLDGVGTATNSSSTYIPISDSSGNFQFNNVTSSLLTINSQVVNNAGIFSSGVSESLPTLGSELLTDTGLEAWDDPSSLSDYIDNDFGGGSGIGDALDREGTEIHGGTYSAKLTTGNNGLGGNIPHYFGQSVDVSGDTFKVNFWTKNGTGQSQFLLIDNLGESPSWIYNFSGVASGTWTEMSGDPTSEQLITTNAVNWLQVGLDNIPVAPTGTGIISALFASPALDTEYCYYDDVSFKEYTVPVVTAFDLNTQSTLASTNNLLDVKNNGVSVFAVKGTSTTLNSSFITSGQLTFSTTTIVNRINFASTTLFSSAYNSSSSPVYVFDTQNSLSSGYLFSVRNNGVPKFSISVTGTIRTAGEIYANGTIAAFNPGEPGDLSEVVDILQGEVVEPGDLIMVDSDNVDTYRKTVSSYEQKITGVISTKPALLVGDGKTTSTAVMALIGRVPVKVSLENGSIKKGDYLTSSNLPGVAMKATEPGMTIGMALEDFNVSSTTSTVGKILLYVSPRFSIGNILDINEDGTFNINTAIVEPLGGGLLDQFTKVIKNSLQKLGLIIQEGVAKVKELFAEKITTDILCVGSTCLNEQELKNLLQKNNVTPVVNNQTELLPETVETSTTTIVTSSEQIITTSPEVVTTTEPVNLIDQTSPASTSESVSSPQPEVIEPVVETLIQNLEPTPIPEATENSPILVELSQ